jgi:hypothetical protein
LGDFNAKVGWDGIFKPRIGNEILLVHKIGNDNRVTDSEEDTDNLVKVITLGVYITTTKNP